MAIQYIGTTISGVSGDTKPTLTSNELGVIFVETDTDKIYQWDGDSWEVTTAGDATTSAKGVASFSSDNFAVSSGAVTIKNDGVILGTETTGNYVGTVTGGTGITSTGATSGENIAHSLSVDAAQTHITSVGALNVGSITSGFTSIDVGAGAITTTGTITAGNLSVTGTTTTVNSTNTTIADRLIELASGAGSSTADAGIIIERGSTGDNAIMAWDESADRFVFGTTTATGASTGDLTIATGTLVANLVGNVTGNVTGNASGSAATLTTARTIGGTSFDGSANIAVALANTATILATARTIGGVSFDGSANINLPGVNASGTQDTSGTAAIATVVTLAGSGNVTYYPTFVDATSGNEAIRVDTDGDWTYNASSNKMTVTNIGIPDGGVLEFGASQDLQIGHTTSGGGESFIKELGAGVLNIDTDGTGINLRRSNGHSMATFVTAGAATLYHNNTARIATSASGVTITGDATIGGTANSSFHANADNLIIGAGVGSTGMTIYSASTGASRGGIFFADGTSGSEQYRGYISYEHSDGSGTVDKLHFATEGSEQMVLLGGSSPKLGIGTAGASPDHELHIENSSSNSSPAIKLENDAQGYRLQVNGGDSDKLQLLETTGSDTFLQFTPSTKDVALGVSGNAIELRSDVTVQGVTNAFLDIKKADGGTGNLRFINGSTEEWRIWNGNTEAWLGFSSDGGSTNKMVILDGGNVGIGTTSPDALLELETATTSGTILRLKSTATDSYPTIRFINDQREWRIYGADGSQGDRFVIHDASTAARFVIDAHAKGRIGMGTVSPFQNVAGGTTDLDVSGLHIKDASAHGQIILEGNPPSLHMMDLGGGSNDKWMMYRVDDGIGWFQSLNDSGNDVVDNILVMDMGTGNVGMGATPSYALHVEKASGTVPRIYLKSNGSDDATLDIDAASDVYMTMRRAGTAKWAITNNHAPGTDTMAIYNHVRNKQVMSFQMGGQANDVVTAIGTNPTSNWYEGNTVLMMGGHGVIFTGTTGAAGQSMWVGYNTEQRDSTFNALNEDEGSYMEQQNGNIMFKTAPSVTAGSAQTFTERFRIALAGQLGIGGANYGTDGQVLTSTGASTAPAWEDAGGGGSELSWADYIGL